MGDHRASIKIQFEMHGIKRETDMWVNYFPEYRGVDERVFMFFEEAYGAAMDAWNKSIDDYEDDQKAKQEREELAEYERLKAKFEMRTENAQK